MIVARGRDREMDTDARSGTSASSRPTFWKSQPRFEETGLEMGEGTQTGFASDLDTTTRNVLKLNATRKLVSVEVQERR